MPATARAYSYDYVHGTAARQLPRNERNIEVLRRRRPIEEYVPASSRFIVFAAIIVLAIVIVAFGRIAINAATVNVMLENDKIESQIEDVRTESSNMEVSLAESGSPTHLKKAAKKLGMAVPAYTETLMLGDDVVAYDHSGNLSLSESLAVAAQE